MLSQHTTVAIILYKSKTLATGEHPLLLRVTKGGVRKYQTLGLSCKVEHWDSKKNLPKRSHPQKAMIDSIIATVISRYNEKLMDFKYEGKDFTPDVLIAAVTNPVKRTSVFEYFDYKINHLTQSNQIGNLKVYKDTYSQVKKYRNHKDFTFSQLDYNFLIGLENFFKSKGLSDNGMSVRFRTLRALFNSAIDESYAKRDMYPFEKFKISGRYSVKTQKRSINQEDIKQIEAVELDKRSADFEAQQFFIFSYYGQGINFVDMAYLKWSNLIDGRIFYKRAKTGNEFNFKVAGPALAILEYWRPITQTSTSSYIFPILNEEVHLSPTQKANRIHKVRTRYNKSLKNIAGLAKVDAHVTSYVARHTFATVLKRKGVSTAIISESMGHKTEAITQTYLKSFENSIIDDAMENLL